MRESLLKSNGACIAWSNGWIDSAALRPARRPAGLPARRRRPIAWATRWCRALSDLVDRFRGGARSVGGEATRFGQDAARFGHEATKLGGDALRRVSTEIERRPLVTVAIAVGVGLLIGLGGALGSRRH